MLYTVAQFIPIFILFLLVSYFKEIAKFSNTTFGKTLAVIIIIFYTILDKLLGAVVCLLIIFYYQSDVVETMLNMDNDFNDFNLATTDDHVDDYVYIEKEGKPKKEGMMNYVKLYGDDFNKDILMNNEKAQQDFKEKNCVKGELMNKDMPVNYEMTEHVFPEVKFRRGFCNPCSKYCEYSIIDQKLAMEDKLRIPLATQ
jgi:hypothetical protein